eukprot:scaffold269442_cov79-Cyclotella_meneghiniana.AAC.1
MLSSLELTNQSGTHVSSFYRRYGQGQPPHEKLIGKQASDATRLRPSSRQRNTSTQIHHRII